MSLNLSILLEIINTNTRHLHQILEERTMESQIFSLQWLRDDTLIACGANGLLRIFHFTINGAYNIHIFAFQDNLVTTGNFIQVQLT